jgi:eukaryotic-like serine/threonine-protein kinase
LKTASQASRIGAVLDGKYEIVRLLGAGGMSEVYEARHRQIDRRVALKFLLPDVATQPELIARFRNEARAAGALQHENIAAVYDVGIAPDGAQYLVMEFLEGTDCAEALKGVRMFSAPRAAGMLVQVCRGLAVAHAHGIVHRDLKPANLFLCRRADGTDLVKIFDFGIAKLRRSADADLSTGTGAALGTPYYMSPEQARGDGDIDHRADIYALGIILYELLSGRRPYEGSSTLQIIHRILTQPPPRLDELRRDLPMGLDAVVQRAMAKDRSERFSSAAELKAALQPFAAMRSAADPAVVSSGLGLDETLPATTHSDVVPPVSEPASMVRKTRVGIRSVAVLTIILFVAIGVAARLLRTPDPAPHAVPVDEHAVTVAPSTPINEASPKPSGRIADRPDLREQPASTADRVPRSPVSAGAISTTPSSESVSHAARRASPSTAVKPIDTKPIPLPAQQASDAPAPRQPSVQTVSPTKPDVPGRLHIDPDNPYK